MPDADTRVEALSGARVRSSDARTAFALRLGAYIGPAMLGLVAGHGLYAATFGTGRFPLAVASPVENAWFLLLALWIAWVAARDRLAAAGWGALGLVHAVGLLISDARSPWFVGFVAAGYLTFGALLTVSGLRQSLPVRRWVPPPCSRWRCVSHTSAGIMRTPFSAITASCSAERMAVTTSGWIRVHRSAMMCGCRIAPTRGEA